MKNFSKILALVLALVMLISVVVVVPASAAEVTFNQTALERLVKLGIYKGYGANELGEKDDVTREQMAMFVARVMTGKVANDAWANFVNDTPFKDINDRPAVNIAAIAYAYDEGIIIGRSADVYGPKDNVTYQEALTMVVRALLGYNCTKDFKYPEGFINAANLMGLTDGISGVAYNEKAIRGVTATILYNALTVEYDELVWTGNWPWPTVLPNTFANKFNLSSGKYMLTEVTEIRSDVLGNKYEFSQGFDKTGSCEDGDYVVFTELKNDVTFKKDAANNNVERHILATELANDLGADLTQKIGYVYDLTFEGNKLAWVDEYVGTTYRDYGMVEDKIDVTADGFLVVDGQKYDQVLAGHANDEVDLEHKNPTGLYDLRLFEYNPLTGLNNGTAIEPALVRKTNVAALADNMFQEVTMFDTNRDGMYDYAIYMPYYIGNFITGKVDLKDAAGNQLYNKDGSKIQVEHFVMPGDSVDCPYDFQYSDYLKAAKCTSNTVLADWNFSQKLTTYGNINIYKVNPASKDIIIVESVGRESNKGEVTKVVNDAITGRIISATVGGKVFENIDILDDTMLYGLSGYLAFEQTERMPTALRTTPIIGNWNHVFKTVLESNGAYNNMRVYSIAGITLYAWPSITRNYSFVTFDWMDANFTIENNSILVVDHALTDASGNYKEVKISSIFNGVADGVHTFDGMEYEAFCDTIDVLYANPDLNQYNMYFNDVRRAAIMATPEYAEQLRLNIMEEINGATGAITPELYAITGQDATGNLVLTEVGINNAPLVSPAVTLTDSGNKLTTVAGTMTFYNGIAAGTKDDKFATSSRDTKVVSTSGKLVMTDSTVFTIVAADGIFTYTGKPVDGDQLVLTADTFLIAANTAQVMLVDTTRPVNQIAIGDVDYVGKFLNQNNLWVNRTIADTWAWNENTNNCPMGFKWLVDAAYLITSETKLETVALDNGVVLYTYTNLYDLVSCKYVEETFTRELALNYNTIVAVDRVLFDNGDNIKEGLTYADVFKVDNNDFLNGSNWSTDTYLGKIVSGSTVGYYEFATLGKVVSTPNFVIISTVTRNYTDGTSKTEYVVSTNIADLKANAAVTYTLVNGVPTGYAVQAYTINNIVK